VNTFERYTCRLNSVAGFAVLLLSLLGAPVNIGEARGGLSLDSTALTPLPAQHRNGHPFGIIRITGGARPKLREKVF